MTFIPIVVPQSPSTCPSCGNIESRKTTCRHCDYEYKDEGSGCLIVLGAIAFSVVFLWVLLTILAWTMPFRDSTTLVEVLIAQWKWLTSLRVW